MAKYCSFNRAVIGEPFLKHEAFEQQQRIEFDQSNYIPLFPPRFVFGKGLADDTSKVKMLRQMSRLVIDEYWKV